MKLIKILAVFLLFVTLLPLYGAGAPRGTRTGSTVYEGDMFGIEIYNYVSEIGLNVTTWYTSTININDWQITDNKDLQLYLNITKQQDNMDIWVEHMHADVFLESTNSYFDGIIQDTMDDKIHSGSAVGFYVNETINYAETFSIEGYSEYLTRYWSYYYSITESKSRLSESELREKGIYGCSFRIIYDIVFRYHGDDPERLSKVIIEDNILLDLNKGFVDNAGDRADSVPTTSFGFEIITVIGSISLIYLFRKKTRSH
jgi:hypothetical protein